MRRAQVARRDREGRGSISANSSNRRPEDGPVLAAPRRAAIQDISIVIDCVKFMCTQISKGARRAPCHVRYVHQHSLGPDAPSASHIHDEHLRITQILPLPRAQSHFLKNVIIRQVSWQQVPTRFFDSIACLKSVTDTNTTW